MVVVQPQLIDGSEVAYDAACLRDGPPPADLFGAIRQRVLVVTGEPGLDEHTQGLPAEFFARAADELMAILPHAERLTLKGQTHVGDPEVLGGALRRFFTG